MIITLGYLFSLLLSPISFALDDFIMLLRIPTGFVVVFSLVAFFEYSTLRSIINHPNPNRINFKIVLDYIKNYEPKDVSLISPQWKALYVISKKHKVCAKEISDDVGIPISATEKMMNSLSDRGYIMNKRNKKQDLCYIVSGKYKNQIKYS